MPEFLTLEEVQRRQTVGSLTSVAVSEFRQSHLLDALSFKNISTAHEEHRLETELPTPQRRAVHDEFARTRGTMTLGTEALRIYGSTMGHDRFLDKTGNTDIVADVASHARALRLFLEREFIYGDPTDETDPYQLAGLQFWSDNSGDWAADTSISAGVTAGGAALSLRLLQNAIDNCNPEATHLVMGTAMRNVLTGASTAVDVTGYLRWDEPEFGTRRVAFDGKPILTVDRDHLNNRLLPFDEIDQPAGASTSGSIYIVSHRPEEGGFYPFQNGGPFVEADSGTHAPVKDRDLEWYVGTARPQKTAVVRIKHIGELAMVA